MTDTQGLQKPEAAIEAASLSETTSPEHDSIKTPKKPRAPRKSAATGSTTKKTRTVKSSVEAETPVSAETSEKTVAEVKPTKAKRTPAKKSTSTTGTSKKVSTTSSKEKKVAVSVDISEEEPVVAPKKTVKKASPKKKVAQVEEVPASESIPPIAALEVVPSQTSSADSGAEQVEEKVAPKRTSTSKKAPARKKSPKKVIEEPSVVEQSLETDSVAVVGQQGTEDTGKGRVAQVEVLEQGPAVTPATGATDSDTQAPAQETTGTLSIVQKKKQLIQAKGTSRRIKPVSAPKAIPTPLQKKKPAPLIQKKSIEELVAQVLPHVRSVKEAVEEEILPVIDPVSAPAPQVDNTEAAQTGEERKLESEGRSRGRSRRSRNNRKRSAQASAEARGQDDFAVDDWSDPTLQGVGDNEGAAELAGAKEGPGKGRKEQHQKREDVENQPVRLPRRKMFVSIVPEEQVEVVLTEEGQVQEYYVDMLHQEKTKGNIYKGVIHNVDPNLQAAFVSYGAVKNGFLQIDEVHPEYYLTAHDQSKGRKYPPIQKVLKPGQEILVQVVKEPSGTKGAFLTTYLSLAGRFLVLTPGREQIGVSRKVESEEERSRLRELLDKLDPGPGLGVIVRTVSMGASLQSLQSDLQYLQRLWSEVRERGTTEEAPCVIYQELDLATRAVRDYLTDVVVEVWVDDEGGCKSITGLASHLFPQKKSLVRMHKESTTLFERFNLQRQIDEIHSREVSLPSGGRLVIDPTEALTAIDINSGRSSGKNNFEDMAYRTNMDAAKMIPLQLRLRDIGGQVVVDFIEMRDKHHWRDVERVLRSGMKIDRARYDVGRISSFGLLEIVRQRLGSSAISVSTEVCPHCQGTGVRRNMEWQSQQALREIAKLLRAASHQENGLVIYEAELPLVMQLLNEKRQRLMEMEQQFGVHVEIRVKQQLG